MGDAAVVIDYGSDTCKAGFAYPEQDPYVVTPTTVRIASGNSAGAVNGEAEQFESPVQRGVVQNWDQLESLFHYLLYEKLGWEFDSEGSVLMCEPLFTPKEHRERLTQMMFEHFNVSGLYVAEQPVLSMYSVGRVSGTVIDVGHGRCDISPVMEGATLTPACRRLALGGLAMTTAL
eukprot:CAMPEP_0118955042 /NCGR_PEP_ID=MMETSP1169-20130426/59358_1 /TAXON_ID=36882 /ORGANISM="Pyramimonas obovata, Strain CCMP722" /LENGTH=175 /DNA_ID=CAMNT_0006902809 /DNA_START=230 /DNA_END=753 /DNA_ORIENTATION=-